MKNKILHYSLVFIATLLLAGCSDAGKDQTVNSGETVTLTGEATTASVGGKVNKYKWNQIVGETVEINDDENKTTTFQAPIVSKKTIFIFALETTEEGGNPDNFVTCDVVAITVEPSNDINGTVKSVSDAEGYAGNTLTHTITAGKNAEDKTYAVSLSGDAVDKGLVSNKEIAIIIPAGQTEANISIETLGDAIQDSNESYTITVGDKSGTGTIKPRLTKGKIKSVSNAEGYAGGTLIHIITAEKNAEDKTYAVSFIGDALSKGLMHKPKLEITIPAGQTEANISIKTLENAGQDSNITYTITVGKKSGTGTIKPRLTNATIKSVSDAEARLGETLTHTITAEANAEDKTYAVSLSGDAVDKGLVSNKEIAIIIPAGQTEANISIKTLENAGQDSNVSYTITVGDKSATGTIKPPLTNGTIKSVSDAEAALGDTLRHTIIAEANTEDKKYTVSLSGDAVDEGRVSNEERVITIPAGQTEVNISIETIEDGVVRRDLTYTITVGNKSGTGTVHQTY